MWGKIDAARQEAGFSISELARRLAGPKATEERIKNERRTIYRWKNGGGVSDQKAGRLAEIFGKPPDYFKTPKPTRSEAERLRDLARTLLREVEELYERLEAEGR